MQNLTNRDQTYLADLNQRLTDPDFCQCPGCRFRSGDLPDMDEEQMYRLEKELIEASGRVHTLAHIPAPELHRRLFIESHLRKLVMTGYAFGADNARAAGKENK